MKSKIIRRFLALDGVTFSAGIALSALLAQDKTWVDKSVSDLGIDSSAWIIFNSTMVLTGIVAIPVVRALRQVLIADVVTPDALRRYPYMRFVINSLWVVPFATMGIGLVPYRLNITLHNSFALSILLIFSANTLLFSLPQVTGNRRIRQASVAILMTVIIATGAYAADLLGYVEYEFLLVGLIAAWVYLIGVYFSNTTATSLVDDDLQEQSRQS